MSAHIKGVESGQTYGNWTLLQQAPFRGAGRHIYWRARCVCGIEKEVEQANVVTGKSKSCGCVGRMRSGDASRTHGLSRTPLLGVWRNIKSRCYKPEHASYEHYGGRGISMHPAWHNLDTFVAEVGPHPGRGLTFDRINNDGNYEPGNVRWATRGVQARNKRTNVMVDFEGKTLCLLDWSSEMGVAVSRIYGRIRKGMSPAEALRSIQTNPPVRKGPYKNSRNYLGATQ